MIKVWEARQGLEITIIYAVDLLEAMGIAIKERIAFDSIGSTDKRLNHEIGLYQLMVV